MGFSQNFFKIINQPTMTCFQQLGMTEATKKRKLFPSLRCLLFIIFACLLFIMASMDRMPNITVLKNLKRFQFAANTATKLVNSTTILERPWFWTNGAWWPKSAIIDERNSTMVQKKLERPWFLTNGTWWPSPAKIDEKTGKRVAKLWPNEDKGNDRLFDQLMFVPPDTGKPVPMKTIYFSGGLVQWEKIQPKGSPEAFVTCPVHQCRATVNPADSLNADAIFFNNNYRDPGHHKPAKQVWIMYRLESPIHSEYISKQDVYNWTITYMRSSDIVRPYFKWFFYDPDKTEWQGAPRNFATGKTKKVAWFVTNCGASNNRLHYARELAKYIEVDMYGGCGAKYKCPRFKCPEKCFRLLETTYKFYLAFENSNCREYITEKFFKNSLQNKVIPVVMGAPREDYELVAPKNSFIHVEDFDSPRDLAEYLHKLDQDDNLFNSYFKWFGMGEMIEGFVYCRVCALLHDEYAVKYYERIDDFWRKPGSCTSGTWREYRKTVGGKLPELP